MVSKKVILHRIVSWWLAAFSVITIVLGYAVSRKWVTNVDFYTRLHMIFEWSFIVLLLYHTLYTLIFVRSKSSYLLRSPKKHWIRLIQQTTKWLILVFSTLIIISGLNRYEWVGGAFESWMPTRFHRLFDVFLVTFIIIHVMAGAKIFFNRNKVRNWGVNVLILILGGLLIAGTIYLEVANSLLF